MTSTWRQLRSERGTLEQAKRALTYAMARTASAHAGGSKLALSPHVSPRPRRGPAQVLQQEAQQLRWEFLNSPWNSKGFL